MAIDPNASAYPTPAPAGMGGIPGSPGMTIRAAIAAEALQGMLTGCGYYFQKHDQIRDKIADESVALADALIKSLNKVSTP